MKINKTGLLLGIASLALTIVGSVVSDKKQEIANKQIKEEILKDLLSKKD